MVGKGIVVIALLVSACASGPSRVAIDARDCAPWEIPEHPQPGLAADAPEPGTVLWRWQPEEVEPSSPPSLAPRTLDGLAIGPAGDVWMIGPTTAEVTHVSRAGETLGVHRLLLATDPASASRVTWIAVAPDGTAYVSHGGETGGGDVGGLTSIRSDGSFEPGWSATDGHGGAMFSASGRSAFFMPDRTIETCGAALDAPSAELRGLGTGLFFDERSQLVSLDPSSGLVVASEIGDDFRAIVSPTEPAGAAVQATLHGYASGRFLMSSYVTGTGTATYRLVTERDVLLEREVRVDVPGELRLDATGAVWAQAGETLQRLDETGSQWSIDAPCALRSARPLEGGDMLCVRGTSLLRIAAADGAVRVVLAAERETLEAIAGPDRDGRLYAIVTDGSRDRELWAIQTDGEPPAGPYCELAEGCNRHRSGAALDHRLR